MKKRNTLLLLIILLLVNCTSKNYKSQLIGKWSFQENPELGLIFSKDSLFINSSSPTKQSWDIDKTNIYLHNITDLNMNILDEKHFRNHFLYTLSKNKDTLNWRAKKDSTNKVFIFTRIKTD